MGVCSVSFVSFYFFGFLRTWFANTANSSCEDAFCRKGCKRSWSAEDLSIGQIK